MSPLTPSSQAPSLQALVPPANCFTVMVVDDLTANRVLLNKVLRGAGYAVIEAATGVDALNRLRAGVPVDLIVTDIEMPEMDGITFVRAIRGLDEAQSRIPVIAASGNADDSMRNEALAAGADRFMTKPFDLGLLRREIGGLIRANRQAASVRQTSPRFSAGSKRLDRPVPEAR